MGKQQKARRIGSKIHNKINRIRQSKGLDRLSGDGTLLKEAEQYARVMAKNDELGHYVDGRSAETRYSGSGISENCHRRRYKGSPSEVANDAISDWMDSTGHRKNIYRESSSYDGVGVWFRGNDVYIAHVFARQQPRKKIESTSIDLNIEHHMGNLYSKTHKMAGRALETPYAPIRAIKHDWWRILPRRRQRSLTIGIALGVFVAWVLFESALLRGVPTRIYVADIGVPILWLLIGLFIVAEVLRNRR